MKKCCLALLIAFALFALTLDAREEYLKGKVVRIEKPLLPDESESGEIREIWPMRVLILEGERRNEEVPVEFPLYRENAYNVSIREGDPVVIFYDTEEETEHYYIVDTDKRIYLYAMAGIFICLALLFSKARGLRGLLALLFVIAFIYGWFVPFIIKGNSPIAGAVLTAVFASVVTIYLMTGFNAKGLVAIMGAVGGVIAAGALSLIFVYKMRLTGFVTTETLNYAGMLQNVNLREIISAGVIIGSMGAVMDVGMSISSALNELREKKSDITSGEIFRSGMNIGSDMIGTMINTLILAYVGSSLLTNILVALQKDQFPMIRLLNFENIVVDFLRAMCGSIGILVAVPITAWVASRFYGKHGKS
ncbi:MAG: YibE/F family protein [Fusobacteriaceae bacterium]|jgi:uncharacterized membrane protein|nr:YibE/F family protein [Fusobacteriaceae bacterium]